MDIMYTYKNLPTTRNNFSTLNFQQLTLTFNIKLNCTISTTYS